MNANLREYRELAPIVRKLVRIRPRLVVRPLENCGKWKSHTHIHISGFPGMVHLAKDDFNWSREGKAALLIHEAIHVKLGIGSHTRNFWKLQREFFTDREFARLCFPKLYATKYQSESNQS